MRYGFGVHGEATCSPAVSGCESDFPSRVRDFTVQADARWRFAQLNLFLRTDDAGKFGVTLRLTDLELSGLESDAEPVVVPARLTGTFFEPSAVFRYPLSRYAALNGSLTYSYPLSELAWGRVTSYQNNYSLGVTFTLAP
jgi:hypothetical protein